MALWLTIAVARKVDEHPKTYLAVRDAIDHALLAQPSTDKETAVGGAFGLMAVTGYAITKINAGEYELSLEAAALDQARVAYAHGDEERAEAIVRAVVRQLGWEVVVPTAAARPTATTAAPVTVDARAAAADAYAYEQQALEIVLSVLPPEADLIERDAAISGVDASIVFPERSSAECGAKTRQSPPPAGSKPRSEGGASHP